DPYPCQISRRPFVDLKPSILPLIIFALFDFFRGQYHWYAITLDTKYASLKLICIIKPRKSKNVMPDVSHSGTTVFGSYHLQVIPLEMPVGGFSQRGGAHLQDEPSDWRRSQQPTTQPCNT
ncbi:MAG: hypothetical protein ACI9RO_001914, partial [Alteromonas macleodii]